MHPAEFLYSLGFRIKQRCALRTRKQLPCRVVSIGNITTGGTGKTPATIAVAEEAIRRGLSPIILTRGYKGTAAGPCFVTKGEGPLLSPGEAGDEPFLMAERLSGVPVVKCGSRYEGGVFALRELGISEREYPSRLFILDDGFQHRGLYRDRDIVLIDADLPFDNGRLLPLGRLREPLSGLGRADVVVLTKSGPGGAGDGLAGLKQEIRSCNGRCAIYRAEHRPLSCRLSDGSEKPIDWIAGKKVFGFCAIGSPESFRKTLLSAGAEITGFRPFRDHYSYRNEDISAIRDGAERSGAGWIVTTEKDIIKARNLGLPDNIVVLTIAFSAEEGFYDSVFGRQPA
ncbi:MAG: tetraacyldisaccharide 4'-kinase [Nitrospiraceae bacterium]|nr:tetraacyldisaccharide 4'-kinase [Nitrospiraceae bacterium]